MVHYGPRNKSPKRPARRRATQLAMIATDTFPSCHRFWFLQLLLGYFVRVLFSRVARWQCQSNIYKVETFRVAYCGPDVFGDAPQNRLLQRHRTVQRVQNNAARIVPSNLLQRHEAASQVRRQTRTRNNESDGEIALVLGSGPNASFPPHRETPLRRQKHLRV